MSNRFTLRHVAPLLLAGALITASCSDSNGGQATGGSGNSNGATIDNPVTDLSTDEIVLTSGLQTVDSCDALLERIKDEAVERVGPYGFDQGGWYGPVFRGEDVLEEEAMDEAATESFDGEGAVPTTTAGSFSRDAAGLAAGDSATDDSAADVPSSAEGGEEFSGTNNQEQDVDEADLVKTDGKRLVIASGNTLRVIDTTGATPRLTNTIELPQDVWAGQMFLDGDRVLLMNSGWTDRPFIDSSIPVDWYPGAPIGRLIEIDLASGELVRTLEFEGSYLSAREIDGSIRIVLTATADRFAFVYPSNEGAESSAEAANRAVIEDSTIEQWIPTYRVTEGGRTVDEGTLVDCNRVHMPSEFAGFGSMIMLTADLDNGLSVNDAVSVFTDAQTMYASTDRVAIATPRWPELDDEGRPDGQEFRTALHTFDITDSDRADYVASGLVDGTMLNQFSMSEHEGYLRVATTAGSPWGEESSESFVSVLEEQGNVLKVVGQVGGLGRGEQIFSVRFMGDTGYVVTFRQTDPLYTVDLSDPERPQVMGELKIPGFSDYLHPVGDDHLLGVGMDGDDDGRIEGAAISLFDVSDLSNPTRSDLLRLSRGTGGENREGHSYTPVSNDAKAFTYWNGRAIVPVSWWEYDNQSGTERNGSDAVVVDVDLDGELTEIGRISHPERNECEEYYYEEGFPVEEFTTTIPDEELTDDELPETNDAEAEFVRGPEDEVQPPAPSPEGFEIERYCYTWAPEIQRSVIIGDDLYTLSEAGVQVNTFDGLDDVTWIPFQQR